MMASKEKVTAVSFVESGPTKIWQNDWARAPGLKLRTFVHIEDQIAALQTGDSHKTFSWKGPGKGCTKALYDIFCPICSRPGQLKQCWRIARKTAKGIGTTYYRVDHYKTHRRINGYHGKWSHSHYLGNKFQVGQI